MPESTRRPWNTVAWGCLVVFLTVLVASCFSPLGLSGNESSVYNIKSVVEWVTEYWKPSENRVRKGHVWALVVAGSAGYGNYRHQADVAHSYHVLRRGGVLQEHIIVMVYDDIAYNPSNPHPGTIRNHPQGPDLYKDLKKDYTQDEVNVENFLAVLKGDESSVAKGPHASGRVIQATSMDRVFLFYSDHGAPGLLGMPQGGYLFADQLHDAIQYRHFNHGFKEMVLYIEACESGSMFQGLLDSDMNVYATTASNGVESSWGVYCPGMNPSPPPEYLTCLGDLYSVSWMEDVDMNDISLESLHEQYERVKKRTSNNYTFVQGSHVTEFGDLEIDYEPVGWYLRDSGENTSNFDTRSYDTINTVHGGNNGRKPSMMYSQREAELLPLILHAERHNDINARRQLEREKHLRRTIDANIAETAQRILRHNKEALRDSALLLEHLLLQPLAPPSGSSALVDDWDCLRDMMNTWESTCGELGQYGMKHSRMFANLCNLGFDSGHLAASARC